MAGSRVEASAEAHWCGPGVGGVDIAGTSVVARARIGLLVETIPHRVQLAGESFQLVDRSFGVGERGWLSSVRSAALIAG